MGVAWQGWIPSVDVSEHVTGEHAGTGSRDVCDPTPPGAVIVDVDAAALSGLLGLPRRRPAWLVASLRPVAVRVYRFRRWLHWHTAGVPYATTRQAGRLPAVVFRHQSPLLRRLGESQAWLQRNKIVNLRLACERLDGVLVGPGETFSFCRLVGRTTARRGYVAGMMLSDGAVVAGVGGGICQIANMLHWLVLHSPLTVTQRSSHHHDPFPDEGRVVPWGTGCTIFYNYVDLQFRNDTSEVFQICLRVGDADLEGELRASRPVGASYRVSARGERFLRAGGEYVRTNEIWREVTDASGVTTSELVTANRARTLYDPTAVGSVDVGPAGPVVAGVDGSGSRAGSHGGTGGGGQPQAQGDQRGSGDRVDRAARRAVGEQAPERADEVRHGDEPCPGHGDGDQGEHERVCDPGVAGQELRQQGAEEHRGLRVEQVAQQPLAE